MVLSWKRVECPLQVRNELLLRGLVHECGESGAWDWQEHKSGALDLAFSLPSCPHHRHELWEVIWCPFLILTSLQLYDRWILFKCHWLISSRTALTEGLELHQLLGLTCTKQQLPTLFVELVLYHQFWRQVFFLTLTARTKRWTKME